MTTLRSAAALPMLRAASGRTRSQRPPRRRARGAHPPRQRLHGAHGLLANPLDVLIAHGRKQRQRGDAAADVLGHGEIAGLEAHLPIQRQQMNRRVVHADADAGGVHLLDEGAALDVPGQHDLKHVPVAVGEILERQLAAERAVEALEIAPRQQPATGVNSSRRASWPRPMRAAMSVRLCLPPAASHRARHRQTAPRPAAATARSAWPPARRSAPGSHPRP
jgi:hypothetical protein